MEQLEEITQEDLRAVTNAKHKAILTESEAQKYVALARLAEAEAKNVILQVYNKYSLKVGQDQVLESGKIVRPAATEEPTNG